MISTIKGVRLPKRSARIPKMSAPTGRSINVRVMAKAMAGRATLKSLAIRNVTNVTRKKSKASSIQPRKLARKVLRCSRLSEANKLNTLIKNDPFHRYNKLLRLLGSYLQRHYKMFVFWSGRVHKTLIRDVLLMILHDVFRCLSRGLREEYVYIIAPENI